LPDVPVILSDADDVKALAATLNGEIITPLSADYKKMALLANGDIESKPAIMILCQGITDVIKAIAFCKEWEKKHPEAPRTVVRGGGHSFWGASTNIGGCVIDLRKMRSVVVDPVERTAWVDGGATVRELDREAFAYGLVMPTGQINHTGIGGLASGGGYGLLSCKFGLMIDNLLAVELVLADGRICQCSAKENPELFWACKGGARWLGVVTRFKFQLHKLDTPTCNALVAFDGALTEKCYAAYRKLNASKDAFALGAIASPPELGGATIFVYHLVVFGDIDRAKAVFDGLVSDIGAKPLAEMIPLAERPWPVVNTAIEGLSPYGVPQYVRGYELDADNDEKCLKFFKTFLETKPANAGIILDHFTGEYCNRGQDGFFDAKGKRRPIISGALIMNLDSANATASRTQSKEFVNKFFEATKSLRCDKCTYVNVDEESKLEERTSADLQSRFEKIKWHYDPEGFFGSKF